MTAVCAFMAKGYVAESIFRVSRWHTADKGKILEIVKAALEELGLPREQFVGHSFQIGAAATSENRPGRLRDHEVGQVEQQSIPPVSQDTKGESSISNCSSISETYGTVVHDGISIAVLSHVYSYSWLPEYRPGTRVFPASGCLNNVRQPLRIIMRIQGNPNLTVWGRSGHYVTLALGPSS